MGPKIIKYIREGLSYNEIRSLLGCSKSTISYHARKVRPARKGPRYDWSLVQEYYDEGHSMAATLQYFGMTNASWYKAIKRGALVTLSEEETLREKLKVVKNRMSIKAILLKLGHVKYECSVCGIKNWQGKKLSLQLDHVNGVHDDNRVENLRLICPNCHSQTDTFAGKNRAYK